MNCRVKSMGENEEGEDGGGDGLGFCGVVAALDEGFEESGCVREGDWMI